MLYSEIKDKLVESLSLRERLVNITDNTDEREGNKLNTYLDDEVLTVFNEDGSSFFVKQWKVDLPDSTSALTGYYTQVYTVDYYVDNEVYLTEYYTKGAAITPAEPLEKEYFDFIHWAGLPEIMPADYISVYGRYKQNKYSVNYYIDYELYKQIMLSPGEEVPPFDKPEDVQNFTVLNTPPVIMPENNVQIYAAVLADVYTITYTVDDVEVDVQQYLHGQVINPPAAKKDGYFFNGWSNLPATMPAQNLTVSAIFTEIKVNGVDLYSVHWYRDNVLIWSDLLKTGDKITVPNAVYKQGYEINFEEDLPEMMDKQDINIYCTSSPNLYNLSYYVDDNCVHVKAYYTDDNVEEYTPSDLTNFKGWQNEPEIMPPHHTSVSAFQNTKQIKYTLTWLLDNEVYKTEQLSAGQDITEPVVENVKWVLNYTKMPAWNLTVHGQTN